LADEDTAARLGFIFASRRSATKRSNGQIVSLPHRRARCPARRAFAACLLLRNSKKKKTTHSRLIFLLKQNGIQRFIFFFFYFKQTLYPRNVRYFDEKNNIQVHAFYMGQERIFGDFDARCGNLPT